MAGAGVAPATFEAAEDDKDITMKFTWLSDIHLNFLDDDQKVQFLETVRDHQSDFVILTGDIAEASSLEQCIRLIDSIVGKPVYFVLGNHDYWGTSTAYLREKLPPFLVSRLFTRWLNTSGVTKLDDTTCIVGHDGWYDCRNGNAGNSRFKMVDWLRISDYAGMNQAAINEKSLALAIDSANYLKKQIADAVTKFNTIIVASHVPPFQETHVHQGRQGDNDAQPFFTSRTFGELMLAAANQFQNKRFVVFAGHTHGRVSRQILPNLLVHVAGAEYGFPAIQQVTSL